MKRTKKYKYELDITQGETSYRMYYQVVELSTGHIIKSGLDQKSATKLTESLNSGRGFDGWTPEFLLRNVQITLS